MRDLEIRANITPALKSTASNAQKKGYKMFGKERNHFLGSFACNWFADNKRVIETENNLSLFWEEQFEVCR